MSEQKNPQIQKQILKFDGKNVFVEIMASAFSIGKVQMNFIEYNPSGTQGNKQTKNLPIYMDIENFEVLANDILSGKMSAKAKKKREEQFAGNYKYCKEIFSELGGISAKTLAKRGKSRQDGMSLSRQFKITPGDKIPWIFSAEYGPGEENATGLIVPKYPNGKAEQTVRVGLYDHDFKKLAIVVSNEIQAYRTACYLYDIRNQARANKAKERNNVSKAS